MTAQHASKTILMAITGNSPFNRSIWVGYKQAFESMGHVVWEMDASKIPPIAYLPKPPDYFFAVHGGNVPEPVVRHYRDAGIPTAIHLMDDPYEIDRTRTWSRNYDLTFTTEKLAMPIHEENSKAFHLPCGYDDTVFRPEGESVRSTILLLGSPFSAREEFLAPIVEEFGDEITWVGPNWNKITTKGTHHDRIVTPAECAQFYRGAKIVLNIHRDPEWSHFGELNTQNIQATHINPRFWEASACGAFLLSSYRSDLDVYVPMAVSFTDLKQLVEQLSYYLAHDAEREENARQVLEAGKGHTYKMRAQVVLDAFANDIK